jgi:cAMP-dependent protein kinase regulator
VESGALDCYKTFAGNAAPTFLKTYQPGEAFGELALLYNAPRAATIIAKENSLLWGLDRNTFNHIVKDSAMKNRQMYEEFLKKVPILASMDAYEWLAIADAFVKETFTKG